jgi:AraC family transcriptional regulator of adaptative response / DNA-3-methyladenine glycosylase II
MTPTAVVIAGASVQQIASIGLPNARAASLRNLAAVVVRGEIDLEPGADVVETLSKLIDLPGIGPWTADYIAMRALHWPDAFPHGDLGLMKAMNATSAKVLESEAENWRPWRAYAAMHLWQSLPASDRNKKSRVQER